MDEFGGENERRVSRRNVVKGVAAGTALAWSAPALMSMQPAFAQGSVVCPDCLPAGSRPSCDPFAEPVCGASGPYNRCSCLRDINGGDCFCHEWVNCGDPRVVPGPGATCPSEWVLAYACCDGNSPLCYPPCGFEHGQN